MNLKERIEDVEKLINKGLEFVRDLDVYKAEEVLLEAKDKLNGIHFNVTNDAEDEFVCECGAPLFALCPDGLHCNDHCDCLSEKEVEDLKRERLEQFKLMKSELVARPEYYNPDAKFYNFWFIKNGDYGTSDGWSVQASDVAHLLPKDLKECEIATKYTLFVGYEDDAMRVGQILANHFGYAFDIREDNTDIVLAVVSPEKSEG